MGFDEEDELKKILDLDDGSVRSIENERIAAKKIVSRAKRRQGSNDFLEFGFIKMWTIVLEFFGLFYKEAKRNSDFKSPKNDKIGEKDGL